ncbi:MAG: hypothetical protein QW620_07850 [Thermoplasmata archaeon]
MRRLFPFLFIGSLSMLFAEIYSGASRAWFLDPLGWLFTFPLYTTHVCIFLYLALVWKKFKVCHLYLFGVLFSLYESWVTKVLWCGYFDQTGPGFGTFAGLAMPETLILVFFWHPVMSFLVPVIVFESLTGLVIWEHEMVMQKTRRRTIILTGFSVLMGAFVANGNGLNPNWVALSFLGTILVVVVFYLLARGKDVRAFLFPRKWFYLLSLYIISLYAVSFLFLLPERIPNSLVPYISVLGVYAFVILLLALTISENEVRFVKLTSAHFSHADFVIFIFTTFTAALLFCYLGNITQIILIFSYLFFCILGPVLFCCCVFLVFYERKNGFKW